MRKKQIETYVEDEINVDDKARSIENIMGLTLRVVISIISMLAFLTIFLDFSRLYEVMAPGQIVVYVTIMFVLINFIFKQIETMRREW